MTTQVAAPGISTGAAAIVTPDLTADIDLAALNEILVQLTSEGQSGEPTAGLTTAAAPSLPLTTAQKQEVVKILNSLLQGMPAETNTAAVITGPALVATKL